MRRISGLLGKIDQFVGGRGLSGTAVIWAKLAACLLLHIRDEMSPCRFAIACLVAIPPLGAVACGSSDSGGSSAGSGGSAAGSGGSSAASGGSSAGASGSNAGHGGASGSAAGGGSSAGAGGAQSCGGTTCGPTQYCVIPCCGGTAQPCFQAPDGGTCPPGSSLGCFMGSSFTCTSPAACCQPAPCVPPSPYCSDKLPTGCLQEGRTCRLTCA